MKYTERLMIDLKRLGIQPGDIILVHSSMRAFGVPELRAKEVIETLMEILTEQGTLLVPALSYETVTREAPIFDIRETKSCVGALSECFRTKYAQYRSVHPTHSVCAWGKYAYSMTVWHALDETPVGPHSPFWQLPLLHGKILMLGCGLKPNTFMHGVEEMARVRYAVGRHPCLYTLTDGKKHTVRKIYYPHAFGSLIQRYDRLSEVLKEPDLHLGKGLGADAYLIDAAAAAEAAKAAIRQKERFFVDEPSGNGGLL